MQLEFDSKIDITEVACPWGVINVKKEVSRMNNKQRLLIIAADPSFAIDFQVFVNQGGHKLLQSWQEQQNFYYLLEKK